MKILFIAPDSIFPVVSGGRYRMAGLYNAFRTFAELYCCCVTNNSLAETISKCQQHNVRFYHIQKPQESRLSVWQDRFVALFSLNNLLLNEEIADELAKIIQSVEPHLIWLETPYLLRTLLAIHFNTPLVVDYWGTAIGIKREMQAAAFPKKIWQFLRYLPAYNAECRYAKRASAIATVSEDDADYFYKLTQHPCIFPVPLTILSADEKLPDIQPIKNRMIMTGDLSYRPNVDAAIFFVEKIFPIVKQEIQDAEVLFVGRNPSEDVFNLTKKEGIRVIGDVPSLKEYILQSMCYILPMRLGSGIRSKLLEVFPLERPIVSTTIGMEGFKMKPGKDFILADTPHEFAAAVINLLKNERLQKELASNAKEQALKLYSQEATIELLENCVKKLLKQ